MIKNRRVEEGRLRLVVLLLFILLIGERNLPASTSYKGLNLGTTGKALYSIGGQTFTAGDVLQGYVALGNNFAGNYGGGQAYYWFPEYTDPGTEVTFKTVGVVGGEWFAHASGSRIILQDDLQCGSTFGIASIGFLGAGTFHIKGNGYTMRLTGDCPLSGTNLLTLASTVIDGGGNSILQLGTARCLTIDSATSVTLRNLTLRFQNITGLYMAAANSSLTLDNVNIVLNSTGGGIHLFDGSATGYGRLYVANNVTISGVGAASPTTFTYNANQPLVISSGGQLSIEDGILFKYKPQANTTSYNNLLRMADSSSKLRFNNCIFKVINSTGLQLLGGMVIFENFCHIVNTGATSASGGIVLGDGTIAGNDVDVRVLAGATVVVDGYLQYNHR